MSLYKVIRKTGGTFFREMRNLAWFRKEASRLEQFRNIHAGEDCFIMGNGPSLNKMDLTLLNDYYVFGLNKIYMIFDRVDLKIDYNVAVNSYVIEQSVDEFENLNCPCFLEHEPAKKYIRPKDHIYHVKGDNSWNFYTDITRPISQGGTVTFVAMQIAFFMGFKRVFLVGCDHNFKQTGKANEIQTMETNDENHFDPNYFKGNKWQLADLQASEISYFMAKTYFEKDNREIFDATVDGKLQVYEKMKFEEALKVAKMKNAVSTKIS